MSDEAPPASGTLEEPSAAPAKTASELAVEDEAPPERPRPKRKKRLSVEAAPAEAQADAKADAKADAQASEEAEPDPNVPAFARAWPRDEVLDALVQAFEAGDYARVRREAPLLAKRTESEAVRDAARELARRLDPDPVAVYMLLAAAALLVVLASWYWMHPHTP